MNISKRSLKRLYLGLDELQAKFSVSSEDVIHFGAHGGLPVYVLADSWTVIAYVLHQDSGEWQPASPSITISGPLRLHPATLLRLEANSSAVISSVMGDTGKADEYEPDEDWEYRLVGGGRSLQGCKLVIMSRDFKLAMAAFEKWALPEDQSDPEHELPIKSKREKDTLYKILVAMAEEADLDFANHPTKSADALAARTQQGWNTVSSRAIENHLKAALLAEEGRAKGRKAGT